MKKNNLTMEQIKEKDFSEILDIAEKIASPEAEKTGPEKVKELEAKEAEFFEAYKQASGIKG